MRCENMALLSSAAVIFVLVITASASRPGKEVKAIWDDDTAVNETQIEELRQQAWDMFDHGYTNYMKHAFPKDNLLPITCGGKDWQGGLAITLVDSLDALVLLNRRQDVADAVDLVREQLNFDKDIKVHVFETVIRVLGGLLSGHMLLERNPHLAQELGPGHGRGQTQQQGQGQAQGEEAVAPAAAAPLNPRREAVLEPQLRAPAAAELLDYLIIQPLEEERRQGVAQAADGAEAPAIAAAPGEELQESPSYQQRRLQQQQQEEEEEHRPVAGDVDGLLGAGAEAGVGAGREFNVVDGEDRRASLDARVGAESGTGAGPEGTQCQAGGGSGCQGPPPSEASGSGAVPFADSQRTAAVQGVHHTLGSAAAGEMVAAATSHHWTAAAADASPERTPGELHLGAALASAVESPAGPLVGASAEAVEESPVPAPAAAEAGAAPAGLNGGGSDQAGPAPSAAAPAEPSGSAAAPAAAAVLTDAAAAVAAVSPSSAAAAAGTGAGAGPAAQRPPYDGIFLRKAVQLADKLLPAFDTPSGLPSLFVHLRTGPVSDPQNSTCTACAGTLLLEFGMLTALTGNPIYLERAEYAARLLYERRSRLGLVGASLNVNSMEWAIRESTIGPGSDSYYEYLLKAYLLFGKAEYLHMFADLYTSTMRWMQMPGTFKGYSFLVDVHMDSGRLTKPFVSSLGAFWPGMQALAGQERDAIDLHANFTAAWRAFGWLPEVFGIDLSKVHPEDPGYNLRPEHIESTYMLHCLTQDPGYLRVAANIQSTLHSHNRVRCGYTNVNHVDTGEHGDLMESYFLSETAKYLYLMFSSAPGLIDYYVLTTEGHLMPPLADPAALDAQRLRRRAASAAAGHAPAAAVEAAGEAVAAVAAVAAAGQAATSAGAALAEGDAPVGGAPGTEGRREGSNGEEGASAQAAATSAPSVAVSQDSIAAAVAKAAAEVAAAAEAVREVIGGSDAAANVGQGSAPSGPGTGNLAAFLAAVDAAMLRTPQQPSIQEQVQPVSSAAAPAPSAQGASTTDDAAAAAAVAAAAAIAPAGGGLGGALAKLLSEAVTGGSSGGGGEVSLAAAALAAAAAALRGGGGGGGTVAAAVDRLLAAGALGPAQLSSSGGGGVERAAGQPGQATAAGLGPVPTDVADADEQPAAAMAVVASSGAASGAGSIVGLLRGSSVVGGSEGELEIPSSIPANCLRICTSPTAQEQDAMEARLHEAFPLMAFRRSDAELVRHRRCVACAVVSERMAAQPPQDDAVRARIMKLPQENIEEVAAQQQQDASHHVLAQAVCTIKISRDGSMSCNNIRPITQHDADHGVPYNAVVLQISALHDAQLMAALSASEAIPVPSGPDFGHEPTGPGTEASDSDDEGAPEAPHAGDEGSCSAQDVSGGTAPTGGPHQQQQQAEQQQQVDEYALVIVRGGAAGEVSYVFEGMTALFGPAPAEALPRCVRHLLAAPAEQEAAGCDGHLISPLPTWWDEGASLARGTCPAILDAALRQRRVARAAIRAQGDRARSGSQGLEVDCGSLAAWSSAARPGPGLRGGGHGVEAAAAGGGTGRGERVREEEEEQAVGEQVPAAVAESVVPTDRTAGDAGSGAVEVGETAAEAHTVLADGAVEAGKQAQEQKQQPRRELQASPRPEGLTDTTAPVLSRDSALDAPGLETGPGAADGEAGRADAAEASSPPADGVGTSTASGGAGAAGDKSGGVQVEHVGPQWWETSHISGPCEETPVFTEPLAVAEPLDACDSVSNPEALAGAIAVVSRGNCTFARKVLSAQAAGAVAVLVLNLQGPGDLLSMAPDVPDRATDIPAVLIGPRDSRLLLRTLRAASAGRTVSTQPPLMASLVLLPTHLISRTAAAAAAAAAAAGPPAGGPATGGAGGASGGAAGPAAGGGGGGSRSLNTRLDLLIPSGSHAFLTANVLAKGKSLQHLFESVMSDDRVTGLLRQMAQKGAATLLQVLQAQQRVLEKTQKEAAEKEAAEKEAAGKQAEQQGQQEGGRAQGSEQRHPQHQSWWQQVLHGKGHGGHEHGEGQAQGQGQGQQAQQRTEAP